MDTVVTLEELHHVAAKSLEPSQEKLKYVPHGAMIGDTWGIALPAQLE